MVGSRAAGAREPPPGDRRCSEQAFSHSGAATWGQQLRRWLADVIVTLAYEPPKPSLLARNSRRVSPISPEHPAPTSSAYSHSPPSASPSASGARAGERLEPQSAVGGLPRPRVWLPPPLRTLAVAVLAAGAAGYGAVMRARWELYQRGWLTRTRLQVPVVSVGNVTWGGTGKTPMVAFTALHLLSLLNTASHSPSQPAAASTTSTTPASSSPPSTSPPRSASLLLLSRGYAGGDESRMLQRQLSGRPVIIAVGRKRADVARQVIAQFGMWRGRGEGAAGGRGEEERRDEERRGEEGRGEEGRHEGHDMGAGVGPVGAVVMDDGMQHWALHRDLDIVMVNAVPPHPHPLTSSCAHVDSQPHSHACSNCHASPHADLAENASHGKLGDSSSQLCCSSPWGNGRLVPWGPMREQLESLRRADVVVIHNADMAPPECVSALAAQLQGHMAPRALLLHSTLRPLHLLSPSPCPAAPAPPAPPPLLPTPPEPHFSTPPSRPSPSPPAPSPASPASLWPRGPTALGSGQGGGQAHVLLCHGEERGGGEGEAGGRDRIVACGSVAGRDAVCLSAIGSPAALEATLRTQLHVRRVVSIALPDHSPFSLTEVHAVQHALSSLSHSAAQDIRGESGGGKVGAAHGRGPLLILTEKDFDRDPHFVQHHLAPFSPLILCCSLELLDQPSHIARFHKLIERTLGVS
ncbi:hypothetical protein CLOM_g4750 [Closterium sp. NIES-68]|nr:hypothetical protein CLOM_g4750 [Closterium sp. NIES-68]GJP81206.1 hypothetical protein CLOP_g11373 [Closterium sp. NIES-67]